MDGKWARVEVGKHWEAIAIIQLRDVGDLDQVTPVEVIRMVRDQIF